MTKSKQSTIKNWGLYNFQSIGLSTFQFLDEDDNQIKYQGQLTVFLSDLESEVDNEDLELGEQRAITIATDMISDSYEYNLYYLIETVKFLCNNIHEVAFVLDIEGNVIEEVNLNDLYKNISSGNFKNQSKPKQKTSIKNKDIKIYSNNVVEFKKLH